MISNRKMKMALKEKLSDWTYVDPKTYDAMQTYFTYHFDTFLEKLVEEFEDSEDRKVGEKHVHAVVFRLLSNINASEE